MLPILSYTTGGFEQLGQASSVESAKRAIMKLLPSDSLSLIKKYGFELLVWVRTDLAIELNGGPRGYVYSIGKKG